MNAPLSQLTRGPSGFSPRCEHALNEALLVARAL